MSPHERRPPTSFWAAAHAWLDDLEVLRLLAEAASHRDRTLRARRLLEKAAGAGSTRTLSRLAPLTGSPRTGRQP